MAPSPTLLRPDADEDALATDRWSLRGFEARERPRLRQVALSLGRNLPQPPAPDIEPVNAARPDPLHPWTWGRPPVLEGGGGSGGGGRGRIDLWRLFSALPGLLQADPRPKDHTSNEPDTNPASPLEVPPSEADDTGLHDVQIDEARKQDGPGGGGRKARDSGKNKQHGDGGRFGKNEEKHLEQLYDKRDNAPTRAERTDAKRKIKNIVRNAKRKNRGENHSMRPKR